MNCNYNINKRLIKITCAAVNKTFEIELTKDENEVKMFIAKCINIPIEYIKGIKDVYNNYYTLSYAVNNPKINCAYSPYYTIVLSKKDDDVNCGNINSDIICRKVIYLKDNKHITNDVYQFIMKGLQSGNDKYKKEIHLILNNIDLTNKEKVKIVVESIVNYYNNNINNGYISDDTLIKHKTISKDSSVLNTVETYFDDKNDFELLKELITSKNNSIITVIEAFIKDNNINKCLDELNAFLKCYKEQQRNKFNINNNIHSVNSDNKLYLPTRKWSINNMGNICERTELTEDIIYFIMKQLTYEEKIYFNYQRKVNHNYYEAFEFQKSNTEHSIELIKRKCKEFLKEIIIKSFNNDIIKIDKFYLLLRKKSPKIQDAFNSFLNHLDKTQLNKDIHSILNSNEITKTKSTIHNKHSLHKKSNTFFGVNVVNGNFSFNQPGSVNNNTKSETIEFLKQIENMPSLNKEQKSRAIGLYNLHDPKMMKLFCMFKRNKTNLTKQSLLKVISGLSTVTTPVNTFHNNNNKLKQRNSFNNNNKVKTQFDIICNSFVNDKLLNQSEVDFLVNKYKYGDETLQSFYEVYIELEDKEDFLESIKMYLKKHQWNVNNNNDNTNIDDNNNDNNSMQTLNYILSKSKFTQHMKQIVFELYNQQNGTLLSFIEVYNQDKDIDETIESIELLLKKISYVN